MGMRILLIAMLLGCSANPTPASPPPASAAPEPTPVTADPPPPDNASPVHNSPDGAPCTANGECASGACEGEGCTADKPGVCAPTKRMCTRDRRPYCGCDGKTFDTSGSCPGRRFASRGACPN